jgi:hypothetical protein
VSARCIATLSRPSHASDVLDTLPETLDKTYLRILCNIKKGYHVYALKVLQWLAFSARPLEIEELVDVLAVNIGRYPRFDVDNRLGESRAILQIFSSLVSLSIEVTNDSTEIKLRLW